MCWVLAWRHAKQSFWRWEIDSICSNSSRMNLRSKVTQNCTLRALSSVPRSLCYLPKWRKHVGRLASRRQCVPCLLTCSTQRLCGACRGQQQGQGRDRERLPKEGRRQACGEIVRDAISWGLVKEQEHWKVVSRSTTHTCDTLHWPRVRGWIPYAQFELMGHQVGTEPRKVTWVTPGFH